MHRIIANNDNLLKDVPNILRKNVVELCTNAKIGLSSIRLHDITLHKHNVKSLDYYHFTIHVPYAGKHLAWEFYFNPEDWTYPPDFDFNDDYFTNNITLEMFEEDVPSIENWDIEDCTSLSTVINELLLLYKRLQLEKLLKENIYSHMASEYESIVEPNGYSSENVEVQVDGCNVHFLIRLVIDCSKLPPYVHLDSDFIEGINSGPDYAMVRLSFLKLDRTKVQSSVQLFMSSRVDQALDIIKPTMPVYKHDTKMAMYLDGFTTSLHDNIKAIAQVHEDRKQLIFYLTSKFTGPLSILEIDVLNYAFCFFMYLKENFACSVQITIGAKWPLEKPRIVVQSLTCVDEKCREVLTQFPYDRKMRIITMADVISKSLEAGILKLKAHKH